MPKPRRTAEDVCIAYAKAVAEVRRLTSKIGTCKCVRTQAYDKEFGAWCELDNFDIAIPEDPDTCLYYLWHLPVGPEGETHPQLVKEAHAAMCSPCSEAYEYVQTRKKVRQQVGAAKRGVEAVGKRLIAEVGQ